MPAQTRCIHCHTVGFVRREHVIVGGNSVIEYYCGHCDHAWTVAESDRTSVPPPPNPKPRAKH